MPPRRHGRTAESPANPADPGSARIAHSKPKPSIRGIMTSDRIRSGRRAWAASSASCPSCDSLDIIALAEAAARHSRACRHCRRRAGCAACPAPTLGFHTEGRQDARCLQYFRTVAPLLVRQPTQGLLDEGGRGDAFRRSASSGLRYPVIGQMRASERQRDRRPLFHRRPAFDRDRSAMQPDQFVDQGQPDASALQGAATLTLDTMEPVKNMRQFRFRNADAGVAHGQDGAASSGDGSGRR